MNRNASSHAESPLWKGLIEICVGCFAYLEAEYGFNPPTITATARECYVKFQKSDTIVGMWCEFGTRPEIVIEFPSKRVFINTLVNRRCEDQKMRRRPVPSDVDQALAYYGETLSHFAYVLKEYGQDILEGNGKASDWS